MRENVVEEHLRKSVKALRGKAYKFVSPGNAGVPDRLVLLPGGKVTFVELKATGKKATVLQEAKHREIRALGFEVFVIDSKAGVDEFLQGVI